MNRILYNVTCSVTPSIEVEWYEWMLKQHIPDVMRTGMFADFRICRIREFEENGVTYAIQYTATSMDDFNEYMSQHAPKLQHEHQSKYGEGVVAFRTILEILHEGSISFPGVSAN